MSLTFDFARIPYVHFGAGRFADIGKFAARLGKVVLLVTGVSSFKKSGRYEVLVKDLNANGVRCFNYTISGEPSPEIIDSAVRDLKDNGIEVVVAVGGGSVIDAGKAISAMLKVEGSVFNYLEGIGGALSHSGVKVPFIAVPTTSGTGSEATKNAVISRVAKEGGFKRSLRHDNFVPDVAIIDPQLTVDCPAAITAACGMDAFTQLIESYVSTKASPMTDALSLKAIELLVESLVPSCTSEAGNVEVRAKMAYASFISGVTLANAGLGVVHGFASTVGGEFDIPHGVLCGTLVSAATRKIIECLKCSGNDTYLEKYANVGAVFIKKHLDNLGSRDYLLDVLIDRLEEWTQVLKLPRLSEYGISNVDVDRLSEKTGNKESPAKLTKDALKEILVARL